MYFIFRFFIIVIISFWFNFSPRSKCILCLAVQPKGIFVHVCVGQNPRLSLFKQSLAAVRKKVRKIHCSRSFYYTNTNLFSLSSFLRSKSKNQMNISKTPWTHKISSKQKNFHKSTPTFNAYLISVQTNRNVNHQPKPQVFFSNFNHNKWQIRTYNNQSLGSEPFLVLKRGTESDSYLQG